MSERELGCVQVQARAGAVASCTEHANVRRGCATDAYGLAARGKTLEAHERRLLEGSLGTIAELAVERVTDNRAAEGREHVHPQLVRAAAQRLEADAPCSEARIDHSVMSGAAPACSSKVDALERPPVRIRGHGE